MFGVTYNVLAKLTQLYYVLTTAGTRNPDYKQRCAMGDVLTEFLIQRDAVLRWKKEEMSVCSQADLLGAPLNQGTNLYRDLQLYYK